MYILLLLIPLIRYYPTRLLEERCFKRVTDNFERKKERKKGSLSLDEGFSLANFRKKKKEKSRFHAELLSLERRVKSDTIFGRNVSVYFFFLHFRERKIKILIVLLKRLRRIPLIFNATYREPK